MTAPGESAPEPSSGGVQFHTTHWSLVLAARMRESPEATEALEKLCRAYWYPLYAYIRRRGHDIHEAEDLTQEFFARLLEKNYLRDIKREGGRFRSYLLTTLKHFLANEWDRAKTQKRGGGNIHFSLDNKEAETRYEFELKDHGRMFLPPSVRGWCEGEQDTRSPGRLRFGRGAGKPPERPHGFEPFTISSLRLVCV